MNEKFLRGIAVFAAVTLLGSPLLVRPPEEAHAQNGRAYFVSEVSAAGFPNVTMRLRVVNASNQTDTSLDRSNFIIFENGVRVPPENVQITPHDDGPINVIFVADQARSSNFARFGQKNLANIITAWTGPARFRNGVDTVSLIANTNFGTAGTSVAHAPTQNGTEMTQYVTLYKFDPSRGGKTNATLAIADSLAQAPDPVTQTVAIVLLTSGIEDPPAAVAASAADIQAKAALARRIPINVINTNDTAVNRVPLNVLTDGSFGRYVPVNTSNYAANTNVFFDALAAQRRYYTVAYSSTLGDSGERNIVIDSAGQTIRSDRYTVSVRPPSLQIEQPVPNSTLTREPAADGSARYAPLIQRVVASVDFPDKFKRGIAKVQLLLNGTEREGACTPPLPEAVRVECAADLSEYATPGSQAVTLMLKVTDGLGQEQSRQVPLTVVVPALANAAPAAPIPGPNSSGGALPGWLLPALGGLAAAGIVGGGAFALTRRKGGGKREQKTAIIHAPIDDGAIGATLTVEAGPRNQMNAVFRVTKPITTIGRKSTDIQLYADYDKSSISRLHCTIKRQADGSFVLIDNNSSNGTRVNTRKVPAETAVRLPDDSVIILGDLAQRGVRLRFRVATGDASPAGEGDDKTQIG